MTSITEMRNPLSQDLDLMSTEKIVRLINAEDHEVPRAIRSKIPQITRAIDEIWPRVEKGGRIIYQGAGTSGRIGVLDASECVPTFGVSPDRVIGLIAGGTEAIIHAVEGAEDNADAGARDLIDLSLNKYDTVIGIAASGSTPYVIGGLKYAKTNGTLTVGITNNSKSAMRDIVDYLIDVEVGPEVLTGSTRMKAGTSQKLILNIISTTTMIKLGKVYENLMIDVQPSNRKLIDRSERIIQDLTGLSFNETREYLKETNYNVKLALVMILTNLSIDDASLLLDQNHGRVRSAIQKKQRGDGLNR